MGQHRQHLLMQLVMGGGHHQTKQYCIWGLSLLVPFLVLFCIFPSGTSVYRPPYNHIVVSQLQIPSLHTQSHHNTLPSDEIHHRKDEEQPITSSTDELHLASGKTKRRNDGLLLKKSKTQNAGIKADVSRMNSLSKKAEKHMNKENDALIDKELDEKANAEDIQIKKSSRKGKIKHNTDKPSDTAIDDITSFSGKGDANQDDEAPADLYTAKSSRKPHKEREEISSLGKGIGADEEDPISPKSTRSKKGTATKSEGSIADADEGVPFSGKEKAAKQRLRKAGFTKSGKMGYATEEQEGTEHASDLLFLENADEEVLRMEPTKQKKKKREQSFTSVENIGEDDNSGQDDDSLGYTSHVIAKALPFNTKQSGNCIYHKGRWIVDSTDRLDMHSNCSWMSIDDQENCNVINKRSKPVKVRWQPSYCNLEHFKVKAFLRIMQRKSLAFVGDKLAKAQMQSLVCLLAQVEKPSLVYEDKNNKSTSWHFRSSNCTISMIGSPYLVQEVYDENGHKRLHLDKLDTKWAVMVPTFDVLVLGVGSLFIEPSIYTVRDEVVGCYACKDFNTNMKELSLYSAFRATMRSTLMGVGSLPGFEGITLFLQPFGFEGNGSYHYVSTKMKEIQEEELYQAHRRGSISNQSKMEVLHTDFISMSNYYKMQGPATPTCLVPSPLVDTWNQYLQHTLTRLSNYNSHT